MTTKKKITKKSIKWPIFDLTGKEKGELSLPEGVFAVKINPTLMAQAVRVYLTNQRKARAKTKTRSEVSGSGRKIWRQKGTGRARHGDRYAPIFVGGGIAHGPRGNQNYRLKLPKKMRRAALRSALTAKLKEKEIILLDGLKKISPKTKVAKEVLLKVLKDRLEQNKDCLLVLPERWERTARAFRNLPFVSMTSVGSLDCYSVIRHDYLIFAPESIRKLPKLLKLSKSNG